MGGRPPIMRADRCPIMRTVGSCIAVTMRRVCAGAIELEVVVHRRQAPVEASPELEVVVELSVRADVELDAVEERQRVAELAPAARVILARCSSSGSRPTPESVPSA